MNGVIEVHAQTQAPGPSSGDPSPIAVKVILLRLFHHKFKLTHSLTFLQRLQREFEALKNAKDHVLVTLSLACPPRYVIVSVPSSLRLPLALTMF
jgi:hypothetical protein